MIGFTGASRTGKSTLARMAAANLGFVYHEMKTAEILKAAGYNGVAPLAIEDRIAAQEAYFEAYKTIFASLPRPVLVDRTPIDLIGYLMAEVGMHATTPEQGERIRTYCERALTFTNQNFALIFVPVPLPTYKVADGKAPANPAYQWHTQWVMEGAANMLNGPALCKVSAIDLETRVDGVCDAIVRWLERNLEQRRICGLH